MSHNFEVFTFTKKNKIKKNKKKVKHTSFKITTGFFLAFPEKLQR